MTVKVKGQLGPEAPGACQAPLSYISGLCLSLDEAAFSTERLV